MLSLKKLLGHTFAELRDQPLLSLRVFLYLAYLSLLLTSLFLTGIEYATFF